MSLLEDVFLEDEAGEAQELERVIEGDEYDERPISPNSDDSEEKEDEAEEDKRRVDPTQTKATRVVKNPRFILNPARLTGPRGIQVIPDHFKDFKFKGKGHEKEDLDLVLKKLEHWAYRLYPKFGFHDCLKKIEMLGKKRPVMVHLQKIRSDQFQSEEAVVQKDSSDSEPEAPEPDEFDKLLQQQIERARATPGPPSGKKPAFSTPAVERSLMMPKATLSPSISDEQRERMLRNRRLAEERKLAKLKNENPAALKDNLEDIIEPEVTNEVTDEFEVRKHNRSHVIDSSDEDEPIVNRSIAVGIHSIVDDEIDDGKILKPKSLEVASLPNEVINKVVAPKHNRFNVIDSSEEDEPVLNQSMSVDVHEKDNNEKRDVELHDKDEGNLNLKQNSHKIGKKFFRGEVTEDVIAQKLKRSYVIDNDEESVANRSHSVNEHDAVDDDEISNQNQDNNLTEEKYSKTTNETDVSTNLIIDESDKLDNENIENLISSEMSRNEDHNEHVISSETNELDTDVKLQSVNNRNMEINESNKGNITVIDEVMDVDFSEDF